MDELCEMVLRTFGTGFSATPAGLTFISFFLGDRLGFGVPCPLVAAGLAAVVVMQNAAPPFELTAEKVTSILSRGNRVEVYNVHYTIMYKRNRLCLTLPLCFLVTEIKYKSGLRRG